MAICLVSLPTV